MRQLTFPRPMNCTHVYPDDTQERVRYGYYESILIVKRNGWDVNMTITLAVPTYVVEEVTKADGTIVIFDEPFFLMNIQEYGDGSGRKAKSYNRR